jgi:hypothetical protein|tara:strand:- start:705 stop:833 length:129 start_codon:yes stop_codon:yes gene_type:complete
MIDGSDMPNWWQWWLLGAITVNTGINVVVFFKHRFRQKGVDK